MNQFIEDIKDYLIHYGVGIDDGPPGRGSGRYPKGSGENPNQHSAEDFLSRVEKLRQEGITFTDPETGKTYKGDTAIAKELGLTTTQFRVELSYAKHEQKNGLRKRIKELSAEGKSNSEIAKELGLKGESTVRSLMNEESARFQSQAQATADILREAIEKHGMVDVGVGIERSLGVSPQKMREALYILEKEGYNVFGAGIPTGPNTQTNVKVVTSPDKTNSDVYNFDQIYNIAADKVSHDGGVTFDSRFVYPASMDSKRLAINYAEDGGKAKDGLVEIRRGVPDLSLGNSNYAQVRILVDNSHYIKGMAVYSDDLPKGVDVLFNTNKSKETPMEKVLKPIDENLKKDPNNPFGSLIKPGIIDPDNPTAIVGGQSYYYDKNGNKKLSLINKRAEEGDWGKWADKLPSQFLAKQSMKLINQQLNLSYTDKKTEFDTINSLENPTLKKSLMMKFADDCDASAVHLKAAALPRQKYQVLIPLTDIKDNEVYAPNYRNGETVALVRYPHGGTFEIPILKVNNKNKQGNKLITLNAKDAIGISAAVAERLSGADFDGDTAMVIPCNSSSSKIHITSTPPLKGLEGFDPKMEYGGKKEGTFRPMTEKNKGNEMGKITNLIADMTLMGAPDDEVAAAVRHSMVVIDAVKHKLDYKQSEIDNNIPALKRKYQGRIDPETGAYTQSSATLITRAKSETTIDKRQGRPKIAEDGSLVYKTSDKLYYEERKPVRKKDARGRYLKDENGDYVYETTPSGKKVYEGTGKIKKHTQKSTQMADTNDAYTLVSPRQTPQELAYADYANKLKTLANEARKTVITTKDIKYDAVANKVYSNEVKTLKANVALAASNAPLERRAQAIAASKTNAMKSQNPDVTKDEIKKFRQRALTEARANVGAHRHNFEITDKEWDAIQAGAVSKTLLEQVIRFTDVDKLKERAMPRNNNYKISNAQLARIKSLASMGYTNDQIAQAVGVSVSTVQKNL